MDNKPGGNLKRNGGEWHADTLGLEDPNSEIPKTGWAVISGKMLYLSHQKNE